MRRSSASVIPLSKLLSFVRNRQFFPAFAASPAQDQPATLGRHPFAEAVIVLPFAIGGLVCSFHATPTGSILSKTFILRIGEREVKEIVGERFRPFTERTKEPRARKMLLTKELGLD
jgi:hypothetical protein